MSGALAHIYNPRILEAVVGAGSGVEPAWSTQGQKTSVIIYKKIQSGWAWWHEPPVVPATQEAEVGESREPGSWKLQWKAT